MMMDIAWGMGVPSAPTMTGFGTMGSGFPDSIPDDEIEGMIDDLGFFEEKDGDFDVKDDVKDFLNPQLVLSTDKIDSTNNNNNNNTPSTKQNRPMVTNDTGAVVTVPELSISTPCDVRSLHFATTIAPKGCSNIALPQPPQLVNSSNCVSPLGCPSDQQKSVQSVLDQQRETILKNQKIIDAQMSKLEGTVHPANSPVEVPSMVPSMVTQSNVHGAKISATYPLARAALKKADEQIIHGGKTTKAAATKRKSESLSNGMPTETNAYKKWKMTPAGATTLRAADSSGIKTSRNNSRQHEDASGKNLTPDELEIRRERNRKHAKKSRLRKKSLTSELEQSLEVLREENSQLRELIQAYIKKKKKAADVAAKSVETLLEEHRLRSHERFIECIIENSFCTTIQKKSKDASSKRKVESRDADKKILPSSGRGIVVDDKTLKVLKGLSKSIPPVKKKPQSQ